MVLRKIFSFVFWLFLLFQFSTISMENIIHPRDMVISEINIDVGNVKLSNPPFYLIETEDNKFIYILGSIHPLPVTKALSYEAYQELNSIAKKNPIFITEHSSSNEVNLSMMKEATRLYGTWINELPIEEKHRLLFENIKDDHINVNMENKSQIKVEELKKINPWLALPILTIHIGSFLKKKFSSFEHSILTIWGEHLNPEYYLEEHKETLLILKENSLDNFYQDIEGINYFLKLLLTAINYSQNDSESIIFWKSQISWHIKNFTWENLNTKERNEPTIQRNHVWIKTLLEQHYNKGNTFLIVVGLAHLEGPDNFLFLLLSKLKIKGKIKRFDNEYGWKEVIVGDK